jgi:hypothetical protein
MKTVIVFATLLILSSGAIAQTLEDRIRILEETLKKQEQTIKELNYPRLEGEGFSNILST